MGQRLIDAWAKSHVGAEFKWGINDCHQLLYQFVKLTNPDWRDPHNLGRLAGSYSNMREANSVAKTLKIQDWFEELGYTRRPVNKTKTGDVVWIPSKRQIYDMYLPVIYNETVICGDIKDLVIKQKHIAEVEKSGWEVYRRQEC